MLSAGALSYPPGEGAMVLSAGYVLGRAESVVALKSALSSAEFPHLYVISWQLSLRAGRVDTPVFP